MKIKRSEFIKKWLEALESGEYKQGKGQLMFDGGKEVRYCCLGVACEIANEFSRTDYFEFSDGMLLPTSLAKFIGIDESGSFKEDVEHGGRAHSSLTSMNDGGVRFKTIAKIIREQMAKRNFEKA